MKKKSTFRGGISDFPKPERPENYLGIRHIPLPRKEEVVKDDDRQDIMFEGPDGYKCIYLGATKESRDRLSQKGIITPYEDEDLYRLCIQEGDTVRLPDGRLGTVRMVEYKVCGHEKLVSVDVDGAPRRWFGLLAPLPMRFADHEIHRLKFIATKEDMEAIEAEANE